MKSWLSLVLLLSFFSPLSAYAAPRRPPTIESFAARANCRSDFEGITYCVEDRGATHLLLIDLTDPYIRVQTVMANDVLDVRPSDVQRERVVDMARRYRSDGAVIAINGDYFGVDRGPEGPTVVQGQRLDTPATIALNPSRYRRTTLILSRLDQAAVVQLDPHAAAFAPIVYRELIFNAISGGPIILQSGQPAFEALACRIDRIPAATCRTQRQTAVGVSADGRTLYLAVSTVRSTSDMAALLSDYGAKTALKLDAGGSSQLWYNGRTLLDSDRGVANALLVFVDKQPRHAAQLIDQPAIPIVPANERTSIEIDLRNVGYLDWTPDRGYGLHLIAGASLIDNRFALLPHDTQPAEISQLSLTVNGSNWPGVYESTWQMIGSNEAFGEKVPVRVVVVPAGAEDLRGEIQTVIARAQQAGVRRFEQNWSALAQRIRQLIDAWIKDHPSPDGVCGRGRPC